MSERKVDDETGVETTGHSWDGIEELNNPLPADPPVPGLSGPWGGIWGHVTLETRAPTYLGDLFAHAANATVVAIELGRIVALYCHLSTSYHIH